MPVVTPHLEYENSLWELRHVVAGIDEAGRGALAGPVVAAAVILSPQHQTLLPIRDSKLIPEAERESLFDKICQEALGWGIGVVMSDVIDEINILEATFVAMNQAVNSCSVQPTYLLIDGNRFKGSSLPFQTIVDGDALSRSIAAASILAKVTRDRYMREMDVQYPDYGFAQHKGYGTKVHREAILRKGPNTIHRMSFLSNILQHQLQQHEA